MSLRKFVFNVITESCLGMMMMGFLRVAWIKQERAKVVEAAAKGQCLERIVLHFPNISIP
jgi:hypothetical protein